MNGCYYTLVHQNMIRAIQQRCNSGRLSYCVVLHNCLFFKHHLSPRGVSEQMRFVLWAEVKQHVSDAIFFPSLCLVSSLCAAVLSCSLFWVSQGAPMGGGAWKIILTLRPPKKSWSRQAPGWPECAIERCKLFSQSDSQIKNKILFFFWFFWRVCAVWWGGSALCAKYMWRLTVPGLLSYLHNN